MRFFAFGVIRTMNILIVGNGFDLSHYLPTKYDHFMLVMKAIEKKDLEKPINDVLYSPFEHPIHLVTKYFEIARAMDKKTYQMNFDDLFSELKKPQDINFIKNTMQNYKISNINLAEEQIKQIQNQLKKNNWYQYFKYHVQEIKTWIDFEQKIEEVLVILAKSIVQIEKTEIDINIDEQFDLSDILSKKDIKTLNFFGFSKDIGGRVRVGTKIHALPVQTYVNNQFCHGKNINNGFSATVFLDFLHQKLEEFIQIFNLYLELIIDKLLPISGLCIESLEWINPDKIYSFNYTNTYRKFYNQLAKADYLHGSFGEKQNIVLGVSDLNDESLKKLKAYGFTKYHQKLFNDTDYLFLDEYKSDVIKHRKKIEYFEKDTGHEIDKKFARQQLIEVDSKLNLNISIWGHSLDYSDKDYMTDLFSLNDDMDRNVRVIIYYFDKPAKFLLLNNLLAILGKDKVEHWMKNEWLVFKPNPEIKFGAIISEKTA